MAKPIRFPEVNSTVGDIPVNCTHDVVLTRWQFSWRELLQVLWTREVWVMFDSPSFPPVAVIGDREFTITK